MASTVPIRDTKDTAKFAKMVNEADGPVIVTKNGYDEYVALSVEGYDALRYRAAEAELLERLLVSERQVTQGKVVGYDQLREELKGKYGV